MRSILAWLLFALTCNGSIRNDAVAAGLCNFGGQGRNEYGK